MRKNFECGKIFVIELSPSHTLNICKPLTVFTSVTVQPVPQKHFSWEILLLISFRVIHSFASALITSSVHSDQVSFSIPKIFFTLFAIYKRSTSQKLEFKTAPTVTMYVLCPHNIKTRFIQFLIKIQLTTDKKDKQHNFALNDVGFLNYCFLNHFLINK